MLERRQCRGCEGADRCGSAAVRAQRSVAPQADFGYRTRMLVKVGTMVGWAQTLWTGFVVTIELSAICSVTTIVLASLIAVARIHPRRVVRGLADAYADVARSIPLLALLLFAYYGLGHVAQSYGISAFWLAVAAITLSEAAYLSEVYRAALQAVPAGQQEAAASLGLPWWRMIWLVLVPQAIPPSLPTTVNAVVGIVKGSSLASLIAISEATLAATNLVSETFQPMGVYLTLTLMYLVILIPLSLAGKALEIKFGAIRPADRSGRTRRGSLVSLTPEV
jgi:His/Glu/Gln/Arg/opine family amino acid ABC transporter permease subunit